MHLSRLYISGFRSIQELDLELKPGKNVIIGRNNSGKSNIVRALDIVMGEAAPTYVKSENILESDFHKSRKVSGEGEVSGKDCETIFIWSQLERPIGEALNWAEIDKCFGYSFWGQRPKGEAATARRLCLENLREDFPKIFELDEDEAGASYNKVWVDSKLKNQTTFRQQLEPMLHFAYAFQARITEKGIDKQMRFLYREGDGEDWVLAFKASVRTELLQSAILPAFRDPTTQLRPSPWTWFGKLMRHLTKDCRDDQALQTALQQVQLAGDHVFEGVTARLQADALSVSFPDAHLSFQFHGSTDAELYKNCSIYIDDGFKSPLVDKGAGIQSATIMGLFSYYTKEVNTQSSALLCVEEPELYLHPHARRVVSDRLDDFLDSDRNQVVVTTHGVEFLRTSSETFNLILVRKDPALGTAAIELDARAFLRLLVDNNQNELFFADKVILCEGFDEHLIRAIASELFPGQLDRHNISVVSVGGKDQLHLLAALVLSVGIQCYIVADFDYLLRDTSVPAGYKSKEHKSLEHMPDTFFHQHLIASSGLTKGKIAKMRNHLRKNFPKEFYEAKQASEFKSIPKLADSLQKLRKVGIGILEGELEHLSKATDWVSPNCKFELAKAYELRERLGRGERISDLFQCEQIQEVLEAILS